MATKREELRPLLGRWEELSGSEEGDLDHFAEFRVEGGCLAKAAADEPLFILRAQDVLAPELVRQWAFDLEERGPAPGASLVEHLAKIEEARNSAKQMDRWQAEHGSKVPD